MRSRHIFSTLFNIILILSLAVTMVFCTQVARQETDEPAQVKDQSTAPRKDLRTVNFLPYWVATAQFAGYYVADEKGIYEKYGIKINIIPYEPFGKSNELIKDGKIDFAPIWLVNAIELKASGADIVNIAQPSTRSSLMLITKKKSGHLERL